MKRPTCCKERRTKSRRANSKRTRPGGEKATYQSRHAFKHVSRLRWHQTRPSLFQPRKPWSTPRGFDGLCTPIMTASSTDIACLKTSQLLTGAAGHDSLPGTMLCCRLPNASTSTIPAWTRLTMPPLSTRGPWQTSTQDVEPIPHQVALPQEGSRLSL